MNQGTLIIKNISKEAKFDVEFGGITKIHGEIRKAGFSLTERSIGKIGV
jgi:hypothetical protein